jgi:hypothetical protein
MKAFLEGLNQRRLQSYSVDPGLLKEHYGIEQTVLAGGYGYRQILELVQNGADAILEARQHIITPANNDRIHVLLRDSRLYVANTGAPLSEEGLDALLRSHSSPKRGNQIGRFGLGFKSLLRLDGRIDLFTRTSGAIRFDPQRCREELRQQFKVTHAPSLRLAWPLDEIERGSDSTCTMLAWAETIVRAEVRGEQIYEHLRQEIRAFPAEFLLFFPVATVLTLEDGEQPARVLRLKPSRGQRVLHDGAEKSRWRVSEREIRMTDAHALADATHIHARERVPLAWAFPLEGRREETGRFWAFFPTHTASHVPGILNAPWKLNNDRKNIIGGEWNTALMAEAAGLVADTLPKLSSPSDPGRLLDAFPRQLGKDEDAAPLVEGVWKAIEKRAVIPDGTGKLRIGVELWRHPRNSAYLARDWQALATAENASRFIHPSCLERQRNSRLNALAERLANGKHATSSPNLRACEASLWFKAVASVDPAKATAVLKLAEGFASECKASEWNSLRPQLAIVPSENGQLLAPSQVVLAPEGTVIPGRERVASALYNDTDAKRILANVMGVQPPGDNVWEEILSESIQNIQWTYFRARDTAWKQFWVTLRAAPLSVQNRFIDEYQSEIRIHQRSGEWVTADEALLPGALIQPDDTSTNQNLLVDQTVHGKDGALLAAIGVCELPDGVIQLDKSSGYLSEWLEACRARYKVTYHNSASRNFLEPVQLLMPKGFGFLTRLVGTANARLTEQYLRRLAQGAFCWDVELRHSTEPKYPKLDVPHPLPWFVLQYGLVEIGNTTARLSAVMARQNENVLSKLSTQAPWAAALHWLNDVFPRVAPRDDEIRELWLALIAALATPATLAGDSLLDLWIAAANDGVVPEALPSAQGRPVPLGQIFVTSSPDLARRARLPERIVVTLDESTLDLWIDRGARNLTQLLEPSWNDCIGPALLLTAAEPELTDVLRPEVRETARCQVASALELKVGETADPVPCLMWKGSLFLDAEQLAGRSRAERLSLLLNEIAPAGWLTCTPEEALQHLGDARVDALRTEVAQGATLVERLLRAVGNRREPLLKALGALKDLAFIQQCAPLKLAELVLAQLGPATLTTIKETQSAEGLNPPAPAPSLAASETQAEIARTYGVEATTIGRLAA